MNRHAFWHVLHSVVGALARRSARRCALFFAALGSACAYTGADNPLAVRFSWFDYVDGGDIRRRCTPGAPDSFRFVYNADYQEQLRTYDVTTRGLPGVAVLKVRVIGIADLSHITLRGPESVFDPWRGRSETVLLREADVARLLASMDASGVFDAPPEGLRLPSEGFFWTAAACRSGRFFFNAYLWPSARFEGVAFAPVLFAWDPTGIAVNPPRAPQYQYHDEDTSQSALRFVLRVGRNGLVGIGPLF